jgi:hypothetical protein
VVLHDEIGVSALGTVVLSRALKTMLHTVFLGTPRALALALFSVLPEKALSTHRAGIVVIVPELHVSRMVDIPELVGLLGNRDLASGQFVPTSSLVWPNDLVARFAVLARQFRLRPSKID